MDATKKLRLIYASSWGATIAIIFATIITIWMEYSPGLKKWLTSVAGHHWTTKSLFTIGIYAVVLIIVYAFKREPSDMQVRGSIKKLVAVAIAGALVLILFFTWHYLVV